jgi:hypothetical protein
MDVTDVLVDELNKKVEQLKEWIASGQAQDYASYQKVCGEVRGLLTARGYILDLKQNLENSDNE